MRKKGDALSPATLVGIILLVLGLVIVLFFLFKMNLGGQVDTQACHESVLLRGTIASARIPFVSQEALPLNCKTEKICMAPSSFLSLSGAKCNYAKPVTTVNVVAVKENNQADKDKQATQIKMTLAREMADCWSMMGEGQLKVFARELSLKGAKRKCVLCARVNFVDDVKIQQSSTGSKDDAKIEGLGGYLANHQVPGKEISYWEFLTTNKAQENLIYQKDLGLEESDVMDMREKAVIFYEDGLTTFGAWGGALAGAAGGAIGGAIIGGAIGSVVPVGGTAIGAGLGFLAAGVGAGAGGFAGYNGGDASVMLANSDKYKTEDYLSGVLVVDIDEAKKLGCDTFENIV